jgi:hypothetical protein
MGDVPEPIVSLLRVTARKAILDVFVGETFIDVVGLLRFRENKASQ